MSPVRTLLLLLLLYYMETSDWKEGEKFNGDEFKVDTTTEHTRFRWISHVDDESATDRMNLIDLLYNEGCISFRHKQRIEQQPTKQLQNIELFQLIKNGSIKTLKLVTDYFIRTGQRNVVAMIMNESYNVEGKICFIIVCWKQK